MRNIGVLSWSFNLLFLNLGRASRAGTETGVLRVTFNGMREDFVDTLSALRGPELDLQTSKLYFGGLPPSFDYYKFPEIKTQSLLGSLRGVTTSNPGSNSLMNPLYTEYGIINPYYGVTPSCDNRILKVASFKGKVEKVVIFFFLISLFGYYLWLIW